MSSEGSGRRQNETDEGSVTTREGRLEGRMSGLGMSRGIKAEAERPKRKAGVENYSCLQTHRHREPADGCQRGRAGELKKILNCERTYKQILAYYNKKNIK